MTCTARGPKSSRSCAVALPIVPAPPTTRMRRPSTESRTRLRLASMSAAIREQSRPTTHRSSCRRLTLANMNGSIVHALRDAPDGSLRNVALDLAAPPVAAVGGARRIAEFAPDEIARPSLHLIEYQADILADHAEKKQIDSDREGGEGKERSPTGRIPAAEKKIQHDVCQAADDAEQRKDEPHPNATPERKFG